MTKIRWREEPVLENKKEVHAFEAFNRRLFPSRSTNRRTYVQLQRLKLRILNVVDITNFNAK